MTLEADFTRDMLRSADEAKRELRYNPTYWLRMVSELGAVGAAKQLLRYPDVSDGFTRLWKERRLEMGEHYRERQAGHVAHKLCGERRGSADLVATRGVQARATADVDVVDGHDGSCCRAPRSMRSLEGQMGNRGL